MRKLPASRGLAWFAGSLALFRAQAARLLLIGLIFQFLVGFAQVGALGFLFVLAIPALTAGVMQSMSMVERGLKPPLMTLFCAFSVPERLMRLFILSVIMIAIGTLAAAMVLSGFTQDLDPQFLSQLESGDLKALSTADPLLLQRLLLAVLAGFFLSGSIAYFAIPLIWFQGRKTGAAILNGLAGILRNLLPFLVLAGLLGILAMPVALLSASLLASSVGPGPSSTFLTLLMLLLMVTYQLILFGAQYLSFKEVFGTGREDTQAGSGGDQLGA